MIKLVAFDWNGTILADTVACLKADDAALIALGHKPVSLKKFQETFEIPVLKFYERVGIDIDQPLENFERTEKIFHQVYDKYSARTRTRAGARSLLKWLKSRKIESVIFSNHIENHIFKHLKRLKIEKYFDKVIANSRMGDALIKKEKGEKLKIYLANRGIDPKEILIVGDTIEEIEIARELGGISVALTDGYNSTARLKAAKPDYLLNDLRQIEGIISNLTI